MNELGSFIETIVPLTNSRGFGKMLRFNYTVERGSAMPLVVSPQILQMGQPHFTRQAVYFLSDIECAIRMYSPAPDPPSRIRSEAVLALTRKAADDCLFEYSIRNPASRLTARPDVPPKRFQRETTIVTRRQAGAPDTRYLATDNERAHLSIKSKELFDRIYSTFVEDVFGPEVRSSTDCGTLERSPLGLICDDDESVPVRFEELPYTFDEIEALSCILPVDVAIADKLSPAALLEQMSNRLGIEARVALINNSYIEGLRGLSPHKRIEPEIFEVNRTYNPRLLDFYFAGLRSLSPVVEFKNYYNIIEYYFEDASIDVIKSRLDDVAHQLKETDDIAEFSKLAKKLVPAGNERDQIDHVIHKYVQLDRLRRFFETDIPKPCRRHFETFGGMEEHKLLIGDPGLQRTVANRIYTFRNAIFHSKRTLGGKGVGTIRPGTTEEAEIVTIENLLLKMIAQEIISQSDL
jgi:hypothetical protein